MVFKNLFSEKKKAKMGEPEANDAVRQQLSAMGDDGTATRHVLHYAYPNKVADLGTRPAMIAELTERGFDVSDAAQENGLVMEHHRAVAPDDFDAFTTELSEWFARHGWDYDGWECAVVQEEEPTIH